MRRNDINEEMRTISEQLRADEKRVVAIYYGTASQRRTSQR